MKHPLRKNELAIHFSLLKNIRWGNEYPFILHFQIWRIPVEENDSVCSFSFWRFIRWGNEYPFILHFQIWRIPVEDDPVCSFSFLKIIRWGNEYPLCNPSFPTLRKQPLKMTPLVHFRFWRLSVEEMNIRCVILHFQLWGSNRWRWPRLFIFVSEDFPLRKWISVV